MITTIYSFEQHTPSLLPTPYGIVYVPVCVQMYFDRCY